MPKIPTHPKRKDTLKQRRKRRAKEVLNHREILNDFKQLSPIDEVKIRRRAKRDTKNMAINPECVCPDLVRSFIILNVTHKYTKELLETVVV